MKNKLMLPVGLGFVVLLLIFGFVWYSHSVQKKYELTIQDYFLLNELSDRFQYSEVSTNFSGSKVVLEDFALIADSQVNVIGDLIFSDLSYNKTGMLTQGKLTIEDGNFDFRVLYNHPIMRQLDLEDFLMRYARLGYSQAQGDIGLSFDYDEDSREATFDVFIDWSNMIDFTAKTQLVRLHPDLVQLFQSTWFNQRKMANQFYENSDRYEPLTKAIGIADLSGKFEVQEEFYQRGMTSWLTWLKLTEMTEERLEEEFEKSKKWYYDNLEELPLTLRKDNAEALANYNIKNKVLKWQSQNTVPFALNDYRFRDVILQLQLKLSN